MSSIQPIRPQFDAKCDDCTARQTGLCSAFDRDALLDFARRSYRETYRQGAEIAAQGEAADRIGIVASGLVKLVVLTEGGDEHVLQILRTGHLIGDPEREVNGFSSEAATETTICWMPRQTWHGFLQSHPQIFRGFLSALNRQFEELQMSVVKMRGRSTVQRLALWLVEQLPGATEGSTPQIRIVLTRRDLASLLDMTVETLCRALHQIEERGAIRLLAPDHLAVTDLGRLRRLAKFQNEQIGAALAEPAPAPRLSDFDRGAMGGKAAAMRSGAGQAPKGSLAAAFPGTRR